jgi:hypothetical protein
MTQHGMTFRWTTLVESLKSLQGLQAVSALCLGGPGSHVGPYGSGICFQCVFLGDTPVPTGVGFGGDPLEVGMDLCDCPGHYSSL